MASRKIANMDQLEMAAEGTLPNCLSSEFKSVIKYILKIYIAYIEDESVPAVEDEAVDWIVGMISELEETMLGIANITLSTCNKSNSAEIQLKEKEKALACELKRDLSVAAKLNITPYKAGVKKAKESLEACLANLKDVREKYTEKIEDVKRARLCRRAIGAFSVSLTGLGLMEFWARRKAEAALNPKWMTGAACGLYACLAISSAVLVFKCWPDLKDKLQKVRAKDAQNIVPGLSDKA